MIHTDLVRGKVFELNEQFWEDDGHFTHELLHELVHLGLGYAWLAKADIEWVLEELFIVGTDVDADRYCGGWTDT